MAKHIRYINPDALTQPPTYTQVVEAAMPGRIVYISGQLGGGRDGRIVGEDFRAQAVQVFENLKAALKAVGAGFADIVKVNTYLSNIDHLPTLREVRADYLDPTALPASTTLEVSAFARPGALLEVEAIAVLPVKASRKSAGRAKARGRKVKAAARGKRR